jgi:hypothetical protein
VENQPFSEIAVMKGKKPKAAEPKTTASETKPDIKVYKCPYRTCAFEAFNYDDLTIHRIKEHSDVPQFFIKDLSTGKGFSKQKLRRQSNHVMKFKFGVIKMRVKIFMKDWDTRQKKNKVLADARKKAWLEKKAKAKQVVKPEPTKV